MVDTGAMVRVSASLPGLVLYGLRSAMNPAPGTLSLRRASEISHAVYCSRRASVAGGMACDAGRGTTLVNGVVRRRLSRGTEILGAIRAQDEYMALQQPVFLVC